MGFKRIYKLDVDWIGKTIYTEPMVGWEVVVSQLASATKFKSAREYWWDLAVDTFYEKTGPDVLYSPIIVTDGTYLTLGRCFESTKLATEWAKKNYSNDSFVGCEKIEVIND